MSQQLARRLTPAQRKRHALKIVKRREHLQSVVVERTPRIRRSIFALRKLRKSLRAKADDFLALIVAKRERILAAAVTPRCPFRNLKRDAVTGDVIETDEKRIATLSACGGRMRPLPMTKDQAEPFWRCQTCGRSWHQTGEALRGFRGWVEVYA